MSMTFELGKLVIGAILLSALVVFLSKTAALFPFYMTIVVETFNVANIAAADNYVKQPLYDASLQGLRDRPIFNQRDPSLVTIQVLTSDGRNAVGNADEYAYQSVSPANKPYRQRGETIQVRISAVYPFEFTMWGRPVGFDVPVSFSITTTGLKYYKDLPLANPYTDGAIGDIHYFDYLLDEPW